MATKNIIGSHADGEYWHAAEVKNQRHAFNGAGVVGQTLTITVTGGDRNITVPAFNAWVPDGSGGLVYVAHAGATVAVTASASNPRMDLLTLDSAGNLGMQDGVATAETGDVEQAPEPSLDDDEILLAVVRSPANQASVLAADILARAIDISEKTQGFTQKGSDIVCAATIALPDSGQYFHVTGSTGPVTAIESRPAGFVLVLEFDSTPTLTHNATSLIMRGAANVTTAAGDIFAFVSEGSGNWRELWRLTASTLGGWTRVGSNTAEQTMTSATAADLVTISGLNIPVTAPVKIVVVWRKSAVAAQLSIGLKLNSTIVAEADTASSSGIGITPATNEVQHGYTVVEFGPRSASYLVGGLVCASMVGGASASTSSLRGAVPLTAALPNAAITSVVIRGDSDGSATLGVKEVYVYQG